MRKLSFTALVLFTAVYGCKVTETESEMTARSERHYPVHFVAEEIETRTVFGDAQASGGSTTYPTLWTENDSEIAVSLNLKGAKAAAVIPSEDLKSATFDADFSQSELEAPYVFYALSPFSAHIGAAPSHGGYHLNIPTTQTPLESSCDEAAQVLVASEEAESVADFSSIEMHFSHVTAYGKLILKNLSSIPEGATIQSIDLTASVPFAGRFYYNFEDGSLEESSPSRTVTLLPDNLTMKEGIVNDIWFACAPADLGGGTFKIDVNTSAGVLSRTLEIAEGKLAFKAGHISKFSVNMANAEFTPAADRWVLVTDASMLAAGDEIIIASSATVGAAYALSTTQNTGGTPGRGAAAVTIGDSNGTKVIENPGATVEILTLLAGYYSDTFYLQETTSTTGRYLYSSTNYDTNSLNSAVATTATNNTYRSYASWKITISNGTAVVSTYGTVKRNNSSSSYYRQIRLNNTDFRTYRSSSQTSWNSSTMGTAAVYIYRKDVPVDIDNDPILEHDFYGAYLSGSNRVFGIGDQLSREYMNDGTLTFAILSPSTFEIAEFAGIPVDPAKGDSFTLNYNLISGRNQSDTDYNVTVVKVDGPKVWLSAGGGRGFIVKK